MPVPFATSAASAHDGRLTVFATGKEALEKRRDQRPTPTGRRLSPPRPKHHPWIMPEGGKSGVSRPLAFIGERSLLTVETTGTLGLQFQYYRVRAGCLPPNLATILSVLEYRSGDASDVRVFRQELRRLRRRADCRCPCRSDIAPWAAR